MTWRIALGAGLAAMLAATAPDSSAADTAGAGSTAGDPAKAPRAAAIPFKPDNESIGDSAGKVLTGLLVCAVVGAGAIYLLRRRYLPALGATKGRRLQVLKVQRLGLKASVMLVRWDREELLLAHSEGRTELLARKEASPDTPGAAASSGNPP
jgi:Flagellar biosynthesis protein, FliO